MSIYLYKKVNLFWLFWSFLIWYNLLSINRFRILDVRVLDIHYSIDGSKIFFTSSAGNNSDIDPLNMMPPPNQRPAPGNFNSSWWQYWAMSNNTSLWLSCNDCTNLAIESNPVGVINSQLRLKSNGEHSKCSKMKHYMDTE